MIPLSNSSLSPQGRIFLDKIVEQTRRRILSLASQRTFDSLLEESWRYDRRSLAAALRSHPAAIIAEIKKASPSRGVFLSDFDHLWLGNAYVAGGAAALSVVTEPEFFQGQDSWIDDFKINSAVPILRKDFILDPLQVAEAAALGADAILLIARILSPEQMCELHDAASRVKVEVLFEAHDEADLAKIVDCEPRIIGVNARNLDTFEVDTSLFELLAPRLPEGVVAVAESGIESPDQVVAAVKLGYMGFLVGESLVKSGDPALFIKRLRAGGMQ